MLFPIDPKAKFPELRKKFKVSAERQERRRFDKIFNKIYRQIRKHKSFILTLEDINYLCDKSFVLFPSAFGEDLLGLERTKHDKDAVYKGTFGKFIEEAKNAGLHFEHLWQYDSEGIKWDVKGFKITLQN